MKMLIGFKDGKKIPYPVGHFFIVIDISAFTDPDDFKKTTGNILRELRASRKMPGETRIYTAGEKEYDTWVERKAWGYTGMSGERALTRKYVDFWRQVWQLKDRGLCAAVYTQLADVETECNGLFTYDRKHLKVDAKQVAAATVFIFAPKRGPSRRKSAFTWMCASAVSSPVAVTRINSRPSIFAVPA